MATKFRRPWAEIDLNTVETNFKFIKSLTKSKICCVVKADAYGHGAVYMAKKYEEMGADFLAVSNIDEAIQLRRAGISLKILILGYTPPKEANLLCYNDISQCVYSVEYAEELSEVLKKSGNKLNIHIKVDTGMSRLGFFYQDLNRDEKAIDEIAKVCKLEGLNPEGIFTHFAVADEGEKGESFTMRQYGCFKELIENLAYMGIKFKYRHCANSAATLDLPLSHFDMVRAGIIIYGLAPSGEVRNKGELKPCLQLKSVVSHVKTIPEGAEVSYGRTFKAEKEMKIATVPIGYADGYPRLLSGKGDLLLHGKRCRILGRVCMDQLMIDVSHLENVKTGDTVTVIGTDGAETITADELARLTGTINYEIICDIGPRVPRIYLKNNKEVNIQNYICPEEL